jgi:hypothetical protein
MIAARSCRPPWFRDDAALTTGVLLDLKLWDERRVDNDAVHVQPRIDPAIR